MTTKQSLPPIRSQEMKQIQVPVWEQVITIYVKKGKQGKGFAQVDCSPSILQFSLKELEIVKYWTEQLLNTLTELTYSSRPKKKRSSSVKKN